MARPRDKPPVLPGDFRVGKAAALNFLKGQVAVISSGMETNGFALTIRGLTNSVWRIDCRTNLESAAWFTLTNLTIPRNPPVTKFVDLAATNGNRFYQVIPKVY